MIDMLMISNFRSIRGQELGLGRISVLYGPNGAGKSSVLYALSVFKNSVLNPNQNVDGFFNLGFAHCGGFEQVVYNHDIQRTISVAVRLHICKVSDGYGVGLGKTGGSYKLSTETSPGLKVDVSFPYPLNQYLDKQITGKSGKKYNVRWNGILAQVAPLEGGPEQIEEAEKIAAGFNAPAEEIRAVDIVPLGRGFTKHTHSVTPIGPFAVTEDEVASLLAQDRYLVGTVSTYLESIADKDFRVNFSPGSTLFTLNCTEKPHGLTTELVNEGFGVNQLVFMLAKCLRRSISTVCIEEPEIHLHPSATRRLAKALVQMSRDEGKQFIISTHSESFLLALLSQVASGVLEPADLACYLTRKEKRETVFERQEVNKAGQLKGGLASFMADELQDLKALFGQPQAP